MAASEEGKQHLSWFEFLFDDTGELLKNHLKSPLADPSASQLIVQFLERSGIASNVQTADAANPVDSKRFKRLKQLALWVGFHLEWNLEAFEDSLSLHWQKLFFNELLKMQVQLYNDFLHGSVCLKELDKKSAMAFIIYCRWVIRTLAQHFLPNIGKPKTGMLEAAENENTLKSLKEQLSTCISILEDALLLIEDLELPCPVEPIAAALTIPAVLITPVTPISPTTPINPTIPITPATPTKIEPESNDAPGMDDGDVETKSEEKSTTADTEATTSSPSVNESLKANIKELVAQVSFDLGTLYFYQEKFEKAAKLFQHCKEAKCCKSSCYTVDEDMLHGYYMSCCGLLDIPPKDTLFSSDHDGRGYNVSLFEKVQHCRSSSYKDLIKFLIEDNVVHELPMDYRRWLESDITEEADADQPVSLQWQVGVCNAIRLVLKGQPMDNVFWSHLRKSSQSHLECILSLCVKTLQFNKTSSKEPSDCHSRFQLLKRFVYLLCSSIDGGFDVARNSEASVFVEQMKENKFCSMDQVESLEWRPVDVYPECEKDDADLKCGRLLHKLRTCFDAMKISELVEELHGIQPMRRFHNENFTCMTYKTHLDEIQDPVLQDLLHIIFTKLVHCYASKHYGVCEEMLSFTLGRLMNSSATEIEKVKTIVHQELLITDLHKNADIHKIEIVNRVKSHFQRQYNIISPEVEKLAVTYLINAKEFTYLLNLRTEGKDDLTSIDYRKLGSLLASASLSITKPQEWRKSIRMLWDGVLKIFSSTVQQKRPQDGRPVIQIRRDATNLNLSSFMAFVGHIKNETCLGVLISCLVRLHNMSKEGQENVREIYSSYGHLWPTSITNRSSVKFENVDSAMMHVTQHGVTLHPSNVTWQQTLGDIYLDSKNFSFAFKCYLEAGACSSSLFTQPVPVTVWDAQVFKKMAECCIELKAHIQAALLCQCSEPKDYVTAFKAIQLSTLASEDAMDRYYSLFWDVTMLEYLINTHFKQGQHDKKQLAIQTISQAELNIFNNQEVLQRAESIRKASLFRSLAKQYL